MNISNRTVHVVHLVTNIHKENGKQGLEVEKESHPCLLLLLHLADCPCWVKNCHLSVWVCPTVLGFFTLPSTVAAVLVSLYTTLYSHSVSQEGLAHKFYHLNMLGTTESVGMRLYTTSWCSLLDAVVHITRKILLRPETLTSFPGRSHLQFLIAYSVQKWRGKAWEKASLAWLR